MSWGGADLEPFLVQTMFSHEIVQLGGLISIMVVIELLLLFFFALFGRSGSWFRHICSVVQSLFSSCSRLLNLLLPCNRLWVWAALVRIAFQLGVLIIICHRPHGRLTRAVFFDYPRPLSFFTFRFNFF